MKICSTRLKLKKCLAYVTLAEFWKLNATCNILPQTAGIKNFDDFDDAFCRLWKRFVESRTFKCEGEIKWRYATLWAGIFEGRESKFCAVLMKYCRKANGEQVVTLQITQQLKTKNINVVTGQIFCR